MACKTCEETRRKIKEQAKKTAEYVRKLRGTKPKTLVV